MERGRQDLWWTLANWFLHSVVRVTGRGRQASLCGRRHGIGLNPLARLSVSFSHACTCARDSRKVPADPIMQPAADETASGDVGAILTAESVEAS